MTDELILEKVHQLSDDLKKEVLDFADYLVAKYHSQPEKFVRKAGTLKGNVLFMAKDFDEPLEDFKEYM